jgi:hypothetical protein
MNPLVAALLLTLAGISRSGPAEVPGLEGTWRFLPDRSTDIATWRSRTPQLTISQEGGMVVILHEWLERNQVVFVDSLVFRPGEPPSHVPVRSVIWSENWFMGVLAKKGTMKAVSGSWIDRERELRVTTEQAVTVSQGETVLRTTREYVLDPAGKTLTLTELRSTRPTAVILVFERRETQ